jgi:hypothetical protein
MVRRRAATAAKKRSSEDESVSLAPLSFDEAVKALLDTPKSYADAEEANDGDRS